MVRVLQALLAEAFAVDAFEVVDLGAGHRALEVLLDQVGKPCDPGLVAVSEAFCIQPTEHGASDFFTANANCAANGLRLCSWTEFIVACNKATELGLTGMLGNWEWTDDAVNENGSARIAGSSTCSTTGTALVSGSIDRNSRCCHSR